MYSQVQCKRKLLFCLKNTKNLDKPFHFSYALIGSSACGKTTLLSSILGMISLESGSITVLGHDNKANEIPKACRSIGYMPQELGLVDELTVKEIVYYFGNVFEMNLNVLNERYKMLKTLLEFPPDNQLVEHCSGGDKRKVSFAASIIHEPDLLILDEPTVGFDPLMKNKIWDFLSEVTRTTNLSVIITTHYLVEAQRADRIGLMRNGVLLLESSPSNIMAKFGEENIEKVFLMVCVAKNLAVRDSLLDDVRCKNLNVEVKSESPAKSFLRWNIIKELSKKNLKKFTRQPT